MRRMIPALLMAATALTVLPAGATAWARPAVSTTVSIRVFDPYRHDYHSWDRHEQRTYRHYLHERHERYLAYRRQSLAERRAYWHWRHEQEERREHRR